MTAPPKTNRKLRKERKNRAKKVSNPWSYPSLPWSDHLRFKTVPRYQEGQGGRAPQEGQVRVGRIVLSRGSVASHITCISAHRKRSLQLYPITYARFPCSLMLMNIMRMRIIHWLDARQPQLLLRVTACVIMACKIALGMHTTCRVS